MYSKVNQLYIYIYPLFVRFFPYIGASLVAQLVKNPPAMRETWVQSLSWDDPLEKGKATHSSIPVWRIPWTVYPWVAKSRTQLSDFHFTSLIWMSEQKIAIMDTRGEMGNLDYEILIILR